MKLWKPNPLHKGNKTPAIFQDFKLFAFIILIAHKGFIPIIIIIAYIIKIFREVEHP